MFRFVGFEHVHSWDISHMLDPEGECCVPSSSMYDAWNITSTPCRMHMAIESRPLAWAHSLRPCLWASLTHAAVSSFVK